MKKLKVVLLIFFDEQGKILLNQRNDSIEKRWEIIGGGIEPGEQPEVAIRREVQEELGYAVSEPQDGLEFVRDFRLETAVFSAEVQLFRARFPGFAGFSDSDEVAVADLNLYTIDQALQLPLLPITQKILEEYHR